MLSEEHESQFWDKGYVTVQLLNEEELTKCRDFFKVGDPNLDKNFYSSIDSLEFDYRRKVDAYLRNILSPKLNTILKNYCSINYCFIVKRPSTDSVVKLHIDDSHVDESAHVEVNCWCPLVDTNDINGCLYILEGSHRLPSPPRGFNMPFPYAKVKHTIKKILKPKYLKAGEAIIYHSKLMHWSGPNQSDTIRPACITGMIPKEATPIIYYRKPEKGNKKIEIFEVDAEWWIKYDRYTPPDPKRKIGSFNYEPLQNERNELFKLYPSIGQNGFKNLFGLLDR